MSPIIRAPFNFGTQIIGDTNTLVNVEFKAQVPKEITLPMRNFDKSLDSAIKQAIASNSQRRINRLESETLRSTTNANQLKRAFVPLENEASTELLPLMMKSLKAPNTTMPVRAFICQILSEGIHHLPNGTFRLSI